MDNKVKKWVNYIVGLIVIILFSIFFSYYYYCIHLGFTPNGEELTMVIRTALGGQSEVSIKLWNMVYQIAFDNFGISYTASRAANAMLYFFIVSAAIALSVRGGGGWYILPLFAFLMVVLHTGASPYYGYMEENLHQYPFDNHVLPTIFALWVLLCLQHYFDSEKKYYWLCVAFLLSIIGILKTDLLFCIILVAPVAIVSLGMVLKKRKTGLNFLIYGLFSILGIICILRVIYYTTPFLLNVFSVNSIGGYDNTRFYGDADYIDIRHLGSAFLWMINGIMGLFNVDISNKPIVHIFSLIYLIRFALIGLIIYFMIRSLSRWWKSDAASAQDYINAVLSLGILLLLISALFSQWGDGYNVVRFIVGILPYATILICRNFIEINQWLKFKHKKFLTGTFLFFMMCCFIYAKPIGEMKKNPDVWDDEYMEILQLVQEKDLGNGVGSMWLGHVLTCLSEGNYFVYSVDTDKGTKPMKFLLNEVEELQPDCYYVIQNTKDWKYILFEEEEMEKYLGPPIEVYKTRSFKIYQYNYDITSRFRKSNG